jgi:hypothetical protein
MIYLLAGKDRMARFNLAWIMEDNKNANAPIPPTAEPHVEFQETSQAMVDQLDAMLPEVLNAQHTEADPESDPHGIYVGQIRRALLTNPIQSAGVRVG